MLKCTRRGALTRAQQSVLNTCTQSQLKLKTQSFLVSYTSRVEVLLKSQIKCQQKLQNLRNNQALQRVIGYFYHIIALTFSRLTLTLLVLITNLRYLVQVTLNSHFLISTYNLALQSYKSTLQTCSLCLRGSSKQIKMLLRYTIQKFSRYSISVLFIQFQKVTGLLVSLKGRTLHLYNLQCV